MCAFLLLESASRLDTETDRMDVRDVVDDEEAVTFWSSRYLCVDEPVNWQVVS
jgi:hypothetical protein